GLWGMSNWSGADDDASRTALRLSAELGCTFYDTAWAYGDGKSDALLGELLAAEPGDRKSTRLNSSHRQTSYAVFCLKKKKTIKMTETKTLSAVSSNKTSNGETHL